MSASSSAMRTRRSVLRRGSVVYLVQLRVRFAARRATPRGPLGVDPPALSEPARALPAPFLGARSGRVVFRET